jgi:outer membrane protein assembly factor BamD
MRWSLAAAAVVLLVGCATKHPEQAFLSQVGSLSKEEILARGDALNAKKRWEEARKYYSFLADSFPNDPIGRQAALKVAESFYRAGGSEDLTEAQLRYKDFSNRFPNDPNRAYALLMLGKVSFARQKGPMRDLTPISDAADSLRLVVQLYPKSPYAKEAKDLLNECLEDLAQHEFQIATFYANIDAWVGAKQRLDYLFAHYPDTATAKSAEPLMEKVKAHLTPAPVPSPTPVPPTRSASEH